MTDENRKRPLIAGQYATVADFKRIFAEDVNSLYLLSVLLTGNPQKAEQCFVEGIGESIKGNRVFKEWARSWARRTIIQSAIRLVNPRQRSMTVCRTADVNWVVIDKLPLLLQTEVCAILQLAPPERFVFVMSVLERFSDHDCSILLGCSRRDVVTTRIRAMQELVTLLGLKHNSGMDADPETVIALTIAQHFESVAWAKRLP